MGTRLRGPCCSWGPMKLSQALVFGAGLAAAWCTHRFVLPDLRESISANCAVPGPGVMGTLATYTSLGVYTETSSIHAARSLNVTADDVLLEIGPGNGHTLSTFLEAQARELHLVELSPQFCDNLRAREDLRAAYLKTDVKIVCGDAISLASIPSGTVGKSIGMDVVYFLDPLEAYIKEMWRVTKTCGTVLLGFKDPSSAYFRAHAINKNVDTVVEVMRAVGFSATSSHVRTRRVSTRGSPSDYTAITGVK